MTVEDVIKKGDDYLEIVMCILNMSRSLTLFNRSRELSQEESEKIQGLITRRQAGVPLAYVINQRGFWRDVFYVNEDVLIPQPDTETLVEKAVETLSEKDLQNISILDLCAGSGCIGISVANELARLGRNVELTLSDISKDAFKVFSINADNLLEKSVKVNKVCSDLFDFARDYKFDCILTNPPYIETSVIPSLSEEVKSEPMLALDGGNDGLVLIKRIAEKSPNYLKEDGFILCEIGFDQGARVLDIFGRYFKKVQLFKDLGHNDRVVKAFF